MNKAVEFVQAKVDEFGRKLFSFDGKVTKRLQIINPSEAVGKNIDEIESIKGYKIITPKNGIKHLRREKGMTDKLEKLSVNKDGIIIKIEKKSIRNVPTNNGKWKGIRGNSKWIPNRKFIPKKHNKPNDTWGTILNRYNIDGIVYKNGHPDFSSISKGNVTISNFSTNRYGPGGNFEQADEALAALRTRKGKPCSGVEVRIWRKENNYTWHEEMDCMSMKKIPLEIHGNMAHDGGVAIKKNMQKQSSEVEYDE